MTKLLFCKMCGDIVQMKIREVRECSCGNVRGKYLPDGSTIAVDVKDMSKARLVGISNAFLQERDIGFDSPAYDNTLFQERMSHIIITYLYTTNDVVSLDPLKDRISTISERDMTKKTEKNMMKEGGD